MKTVTIPTCANPFVVIINGKKYTYPAGATMEVPDEVAEVIERHEEAKPEPAPVQPPYSGGMNGDDILAAAKAYTDKKCEGAGGGGLPVVELTEQWDLETSPFTLSDDDSAKMDAAAELGLPINAVLLNNEFARMALLMYFLKVEGQGVMFTGIMMMGSTIMPVQIAKDETSWVLQSNA